MGFSELKKEFDRLSDEDLKDEERFRYWLLRLLFEMNGNLDSMAVAYRNMEKSYARIVELNEKRQQPK